MCEQNKALTQVQAEKVLAEDSTCKVPLVHVGPVYKYWMKKRYCLVPYLHSLLTTREVMPCMRNDEPTHHPAHRKGRKQPLIERFHEPPAFDDPSPLVAFRPREPFSKQPKKVLALIVSDDPRIVLLNSLSLSLCGVLVIQQLGNRKNDKIAYNKMTQLRREFERSRMLLEMIKKREKLKRDQIQIAFDLFELRVVRPTLLFVSLTSINHRHIDDNARLAEGRGSAHGRST
jgi:hypothetical protein